ncbi:hypothetical protein QYF36_017408 [Acer negundo]|nr:hypothetical protein QYF36_017408 [Acer negundo]
MIPVPSNHGSELEPCQDDKVKCSSSLNHSPTSMLSIKLTDTANLNSRTEQHKHGHICKESSSSNQQNRATQTWAYLQGVVFIKPEADCVMVIV